MAQNGNILLVYNNDTLIGGVKSNGIKVSGDLEDVSAPGDGEWKHYKPGRKGGSITIGYLVLADSALGVSGGSGIKDVLQVNELFTLKFKGRNSGGDPGVVGSFYLQECDIQATRGNLVTGTFRFILNGALTAGTAPSEET